jgi:hypothetical protein
MLLHPGQHRRVFRFLLPQVLSAYGLITDREERGPYQGGTARGRPNATRIRAPSPIVGVTVPMAAAA